MASFDRHPFHRRNTDILLTRKSSSIQNSTHRHCYEVKVTVPLTTRWLYLKVNHSSHNVLEASLLFDVGLGYQKINAFPLNCINGIISTSVLKFPRHIKKIRLLIETDDKAKEETIPLNLTPICKVEALARVGFYLYKINKLRGISPRHLISEKFHQIRKAGVFNIIKNLDQFINYSNSSRPITYNRWIQTVEPKFLLKYNDRPAITSSSPMFSIACEASSDLDELMLTLQSIHQQTYTKWELIILGDKNFFKLTNDKINPLTIDARINIKRLSPSFPENIISQTLYEMKGDYGFWMASGDQLPSCSLACWVDTIKKQTDKIFWYSDSDDIDPNNNRCSPNFKPSWNKELFYSQDYIGNSCLAHIPTAKECCDVKELTNDAAGYDLLLHLIEHHHEEHIGRVAKVLYHNRKNSPGNINLHLIKQQRFALKKHFQRLGLNIVVKPGLLPYTHRLCYPLPEILPSVTLIIPTRDQVSILKKCIRSLLEITKYPKLKILVVNNRSKKRKSLAYFKQIKKSQNINVVNYDKPFNFAAINNFAVDRTKTELICLVNNDIEVVCSNWLHEMVQYAVQKDIGCVGAKLIYQDRSVQHGGVICGIGDVAGHAHRYLKHDSPGYFGRLQSSQYFSAVTAACLMVRRDVYLEANGMTEQLAVDYNDIDFCLKVRELGYKNVYTPYAELYHYESLSRGSPNTPEKLQRYRKEVGYMWKSWPNELKNDVFYNPNLSHVREDFSL